MTYNMQQTIASAVTGDGVLLHMQEVQRHHDGMRACLLTMQQSAKELLSAAQIPAGTAVALRLVASLANCTPGPPTHPAAPATSAAAAVPHPSQSVGVPPSAQTAP